MITSHFLQKSQTWISQAYKQGESLLSQQQIIELFGFFFFSKHQKYIFYITSYF